MNCSRKDRAARVQRPFYNPFEVAICGNSMEDRACLIAKTVAVLSADYVVGQVIERGPQMDNQTVARMGVNLVIGDGQNGLLYPQAMDSFLGPRPLMDVDMVIVESLSDTPMPKLVWMEDGEPPKYSNVIGYVGRRQTCPILPSDANFFTEDQTLELKRFLEDYFKAKADAVPLYGLVLVGGRSTRMAADKGMLEYHGRPQVTHCVELLRPYCDEVFLSLRNDQQDVGVYGAYPQIHDAFSGFGPLGGILSAQMAHPDAAWLVLACDLPNVTASTIESLLTQRNPFKLATAFNSANDDLPEPLCAVYEPKSIHRLLGFLGLGYRCPRKVLINSDTCLLKPHDRRALDNVNSIAEREQTIRRMHNVEVSPQ